MFFWGWPIFKCKLLISGRVTVFHLENKRNPKTEISSDQPAIEFQGFLLVVSERVTHNNWNTSALQDGTSQLDQAIDIGHHVTDYQLGMPSDCCFSCSSKRSRRRWWNLPNMSKWVQFRSTSLLCSRVQAGMHEQLHWSKNSQATAPHTTLCPKTKKTSYKQKINMGSDIIGILDLHAKHMIFFIQQCLAPWHGLLGESATRKHSQAVQSVCKWCWLAGIVTTWNPNDPCFDWFRAFLWRVGALLFRNQDLGNHMKSLHFINMDFLKGGEFPFVFATILGWRPVTVPYGVSKSGALNPMAVPTQKENEPFRKWFRKFSQFAPGHYKEKKLVTNRLKTLFFQVLPFLPILTTLAPIFAPVLSVKNIG